MSEPKLTIVKTRSVNYPYQLERLLDDKWVILKRYATWGEANSALAVERERILREEDL